MVDGGKMMMMVFLLEHGLKITTQKNTFQILIKNLCLYAKTTFNGNAMILANKLVGKGNCF